MGRDASGKNRKWGQHKDKDVEDINEENLMAMLNKVQNDDDEEEEDEEEDEEEEEEEEEEQHQPEEKKDEDKNKPKEEVKIMEIPMKAKDADKEEEDDDDDDEEKDTDGRLIKVANPNRNKKPTGGEYKVDKKDKEKLADEKALKRELKDIKLGKSEQAREEMARLQAIRKRREEAAKDKAEQEAKLEAARKEAEQNALKFKKKKWECGFLIKIRLVFLVKHGPPCEAYWISWYILHK